tara:strand:+ start:222 stop:470 length:249 start_codon:yes stop_codon:yes gene_type:complete
MDILWIILAVILSVGIAMPIVGMCVFVLLGIANLLFNWLNDPKWDKERIIHFIPEDWNFLIISYGVGAGFLLLYYLVLNIPD